MIPVLWTVMIARVRSVMQRSMVAAERLTLPGSVSAKTDLVVAGPGALDRLGLSWETTSERNPRLIYCSEKGFLPGPYEQRTALDEVAQMMGGLAYMTGPPGRPLR